MFNKKYKEQIKQLEAINQQLNNKISEQSIQLAIEKSARSELTKKIIELQEKYRDGLELDKIKDKINAKKDELNNIEIKIVDTKAELESIQKELVQSQNKHDIQTMGLYSPLIPKYSTEEYKQKIIEVRRKRGTMLNKKEYYTTKGQWTYNGNAIQGSKLLNFFTKQSITAFNLSIDALIDRVTISNIRDLKDRTTKIFNNINEELNKHEIYLKHDYLYLTLKELDYRYELELKKQQDKEEREYQKLIIKEQEAVEKELDNVVTKYNPDSTVALVMDPNSGEVLAMSSRPNFDSNNYKNYNLETINRNLPIWMTYEPGSTFKNVNTI